MKKAAIKFLSGRPFGCQEHGRSTMIVLIIIACCMTMLFIAACSKDSSQSAPQKVAAQTDKSVPAGAVLLDTRCSVCHSADKPKSAKKSHAEWEKTVGRMVGKGAKLNNEEKAVLIDYLAKTYKS